MSSSLSSSSTPPGSSGSFLSHCICSSCSASSAHASGSHAVELVALAAGKEPPSLYGERSDRDAEVSVTSGLYDISNADVVDTIDGNDFGSGR